MSERQSGLMPFAMAAKGMANWQSVDAPTNNLLTGKELIGKRCK